MKVFYTATVKIANGDYESLKTFYFETAQERFKFIDLAKVSGHTVRGYSIEHMLSPADAISECECELARM